MSVTTKGRAGALFCLLVLVSAHVYPQTRVIGVLLPTTS
jgi:hypothetical protein